MTHDLENIFTIQYIASITYIPYQIKESYFNFKKNTYALLTKGNLF